MGTLREGLESNPVVPPTKEYKEYPNTDPTSQCAMVKTYPIEIGPKQSTPVKCRQVRGFPIQGAAAWRRNDCIIFKFWVRKPCLYTPADWSLLRNNVRLNGVEGGGGV